MELHESKGCNGAYIEVGTLALMDHIYLRSVAIPMTSLFLFKEGKTLHHTLFYIC